MRFNTSLYGMFISSLITLSIPALSQASPVGTAPVSGFARSFITLSDIPNATITLLETGQKLQTNSHGQFGPIFYPIGKPITFLFEKSGYKTTQSGTTIVPPSGLTGPQHNISFQIPSTLTFYSFAKIIGAKFDDEKCHVVTTVLANGRTLEDEKQGEPDAIITLSPAINETPFYFDIFKGWLFHNKTNPFTKGLTATSEDGGVGYANLPPSDKPYTLSAQKAGVTFSTAQFICRKGAFINISPPRGPMALK